MSPQTGLWVGGLVTLMAWSYLYKENPLFRLVEHIFVGGAMAYGVFTTYYQVILPTWQKDMVKDGNWSYLIPIAIGLLIYTRYAGRGWSWLARWTMAFWVGYGAGYELAYTPAVFMKQVTDTFRPIKGINDVLYFLIVAAALYYFLFTVRKEGPAQKGISWFGRYSLMVAFGAAFGSITMAYLSLIIGRLQYLLRDVTHLIK